VKGECIMKSMAIGLMIALALIGCATIQKGETLDKEQMLAAAGFFTKLADTPEKLAALQGLPQHRLITGAKDGRMIYLYADATACKCMYVGNEKAYQRYRRFALEKQIAREELYSAQTNADMNMDWGMWGPWGFDGPME
jgi:hypothetical protein